MSNTKYLAAYELADRLKERYGATVPTSQAAAMLRQLVQEHAELLEALQEAAMLISGGGEDEDWARLGAKYSKTGDEFGATEKDVREGVAATMRAAIAKATGSAE
jgi:hypothetical protein